MPGARCSWLVVTLALAGVPAIAAEEDEFSEVLKRPGYRSAFEQMLKGEKNLSQWMATPEALDDATTLSGSKRIIAGEEEEVFELCKSHECDDTGFIVMFSKHGEVAKGLLSDKQDLFLGQPTEEEKKALTALKRSD